MRILLIPHVRVFIGSVRLSLPLSHSPCLVGLPVYHGTKVAVEIPTIPAFDCGHHRVGRLRVEAVGVLQYPSDIGQIPGNAPIESKTEIEQIGIAQDTRGQADGGLSFRLKECGLISVCV